MVNVPNGRGIWSVLLVLVGCGCGSSSKPPQFLGKLAPVTGTVKVDGKPIAGIQVTFVPSQGMGSQNNPNQGQLAVGTTDESGNYSLVTPPGGEIDTKDLSKYEGALPGKYDATFALWVMPDGQPWAAQPDQKQGPMASGATEKLPPPLANPRTTPHKAEVKASGENKFDFDLKSK